MVTWLEVLLMLSDAVKCEFSLLLPKSLLCALASSRLAFGAKAAFLSLLCLVLVVLLLLMWQRLIGVKMCRWAWVQSH